MSTNLGNRKLIKNLLCLWLLMSATQAIGQSSEQAERLSEMLQQSRAYQQAQADRSAEQQRREIERSLALLPPPLKAKWREVTNEELAMTRDPRAPEAPAVYLYTEQARSETERRELVYRQIKILTEEGRDRANISISYDKRGDSISGIEARVIQADGKIIPFKGKIYDRSLLSSRQVSWGIKSIALPDVRVGSVIEYRYWRKIRSSTPARWILNQELFTRHARYSWQVDAGSFAHWKNPEALPADIPAPKLGADGVYRMEVHNIPSFVAEDYMPPLEDLVLSVDFDFGSLDFATFMSAPDYWRTWGAAQRQSIDSMLGDPAKAAQRLEVIVGSADSPEQKVRKIYEHIRQLGNADFVDLIGQNAAKKCGRIRKNVLEVGIDGCGSSIELQLYFFALVRAAGISAIPVLAASRAERFFTPESKDTSRIDDLLVAVTINGREILLNPAVPFLPFGSLVWFETAVPGLKLLATGGEWFTTPIPAPEDAVTRRSAKFMLTDDGVLEGAVIVNYSGHEAITRVFGLLRADEQSRIGMLKEDLSRVLAVPAEITVVRQPELHGNSGILETEYRVKVSNWALSSGDRFLVGFGLFGGEQIGKFISAKREQPIYFPYPFATEDHFEIDLPAGFSLRAAPARQVSPDAALKYDSSVVSKDGKIFMHRSMLHNLLLARQVQYPRVKKFYEQVRSADQEQVVLTREVNALE